MRNLRGVLLDVDGTLVDSNDAHAHAWVLAMAEFDYQVEFGMVRRLIGKGGDKLLPESIGVDGKSPMGVAISNRRGEIFQKNFIPQLQPFGHVRELLARMKRRGLRLAIASSAKADELKSLLRICGADEFVETTTSSDDAESSKPDPDIIHAALEQLNLPADSVLFLGDTPYDIEAGLRAGVQTITLRCGGWGDQELHQAIGIYDNPRHLLVRFEESPFHTKTKKDA